jgi:hypothetical protein
MARSAASIQTEITALEAQIAVAAASASYTINGRTKVSQSYTALCERLDRLYVHLGRANGTEPMIVRGVVKNLRGPY